MYHNTYNSKPITCGQKGRGIDWNPLKQHMQQLLGQVPSLSQKLSREELDKLGFKAASNGLFPIFQGGFDGRNRNDYAEERMYGSRR